MSKEEFDKILLNCWKTRVSVYNFGQSLKKSYFEKKYDAALCESFLEMIFKVTTYGGKPSPFMCSYLHEVLKTGLIHPHVYFSVFHEKFKGDKTDEVWNVKFLVKNSAFFEATFLNFCCLLLNSGSFDGIDSNFYLNAEDAICMKALSLADEKVEEGSLSEFLVEEAKILSRPSFTSNEAKLCNVMKSTLVLLKFILYFFANQNSTASQIGISTTKDEEGDLDMGIRERQATRVLKRTFAALLFVFFDRKCQAMLQMLRVEDKRMYAHIMHGVHEIDRMLKSADSDLSKTMSDWLLNLMGVLNENVLLKLSVANIDVQMKAKNWSQERFSLVKFLRVAHQPKDSTRSYFERADTYGRIVPLLVIMVEGEVFARNVFCNSLDACVDKFANFLIDVNVDMEQLFIAMVIASIVRMNFISSSTKIDRSGKLVLTNLWRCFLYVKSIMIMHRMLRLDEEILPFQKSPSDVIQAILGKLANVEFFNMQFQNNPKFRVPGTPMTCLKIVRDNFAWYVVQHNGIVVFSPTPIRLNRGNVVTFPPQSKNMNLILQDPLRTLFCLEQVFSQESHVVKLLEFFLDDLERMEILNFLGLVPAVIRTLVVYLEKFGKDNVNICESNKKETQTVSPETENRFSIAFTFVYSLLSRYQFNKKKRHREFMAEVMSNLCNHPLSSWIYGYITGSIGTKSGIATLNLFQKLKTQSQVSTKCIDLLYSCSTVVENSLAEVQGSQVPPSEIVSRFLKIVSLGQFAQIGFFYALTKRIHLHLEMIGIDNMKNIFLPVMESVSRGKIYYAGMLSEVVSVLRSFKDGARVKKLYDGVRAKGKELVRFRSILNIDSSQNQSLQMHLQSSQFLKDLDNCFFSARDILLNNFLKSKRSSHNSSYVSYLFISRIFENFEFKRFHNAEVFCRAAAVLIAPGRVAKLLERFVIEFYFKDRYAKTNFSNAMHITAVFGLLLLNLNPKVDVEYPTVGKSAKKKKAAIENFLSFVVKMTPNCGRNQRLRLFLRFFLDSVFPKLRRFKLDKHLVYRVVEVVLKERISRNAMMAMDFEDKEVRSKCYALFNLLN